MCRFKYTPRGAVAIPKRCHNCGEEGTVEKEPDANQILKESNFF
jgi:hypothetical protein